jgi:glycerophosphoryl diester phosphodiesterase
MMFFVIFLAVLFYFLFQFSVQKPSVQAWPVSWTLPSYQVHRGYWMGGLPENTLDSLREAKARGGQMCEFDVRLSADQEVVLFHDENLLRMFQSEQKVHEMTASQLKEQWGVSTLKEVLEDSEVPDYLNIELKTSLIWNDPLPKKVAELTKNSNKKILVSSFNPFALRTFLLRNKNAVGALLVSEEEHKDNKIWLKKMWFLNWSRAHMINLDQNMVNKSRLSYWNLRNIPVAVWTVNEASKAQELLSFGAVSIISDSVHHSNKI